MKKTTNCNLYKDKEFDVYCGRGRGEKNNPLNCKPGEPGWLGNPFSLGKKCIACGKIHQETGETLSCFERYLRLRLEHDPDFKAEFIKLKGLKLGCYCKPKACHTDVMIKILDEEF